jgi:hypothetical protein
MVVDAGRLLAWMMVEGVVGLPAGKDEECRDALGAGDRP